MTERDGQRQRQKEGERRGWFVQHLFNRCDIIVGLAAIEIVVQLNSLVFFFGSRWPAQWCRDKRACWHSLLIDQDEETHRERKPGNVYDDAAVLAEKPRLEEWNAFALHFDAQVKTTDRCPEVQRRTAGRHALADNAVSTAAFPFPLSLKTECPHSVLFSYIV